MSKQHKPPVIGSAALAERIRIAREEGRSQQALELAKQLHKSEPTPGHLDLLKKCYTERAARLRDTGHTRDAANVLDVASRLDEQNVAWLAEIAAELGRCGDLARARQLSARVAALGGSSKAAALESEATGAAVDTAIAEGKATKVKLTPELAAEVAAVTAAFAHLAAGRDAEATSALAPVGLRSPCLEWKLLVRGFQGYYAGDDQRARDNWSRLSPARLPARLAAPFRASIDAEYRNAQPEATRAALARQLNERMGTPAAELRRLRVALEGENNQRLAFEIAEGVVGQLRESGPKLIPKLADVMYSAIVNGGPGSISAYRRVFGPRADDPNFKRAEALGRRDDPEAIAAWAHYERDIAADRHKLWPGDEGRIARALVFAEMGRIGSRVPTKKQLEHMPEVLRRAAAGFQAVKPSPVECFAKAVELAPELIEARSQWLDRLVAEESIGPAIEVGEALLKVAPDHVETLRKLARLYARADRRVDQAGAMERALRHNPLDKGLRRDAGLAYLQLARELAEAADIEKARPYYRSALDLVDSDVEKGGVQVRWAVAEERHGQAERAAELLAAGEAAIKSKPAFAYSVMVESHRMELPSKVKAARNKAFNNEIANPPGPNDVLALVGLASGFAKADVTYYGQKTHNKKIAEFAVKAGNTFDEASLRLLLGALPELKPPVRALENLFHEARRAYRDNPWFHYLEAVHLMGDGSEEDMSSSVYRLGPLMREAERLALKRPPEEPGLREMLDDIARRQTILRMMNPFLGGFERLSGGAFDDFFDGFSFGDEDDE